MGIGKRREVQPEQRQAQRTYHKPLDTENSAMAERHPRVHAISPVERSCKHAPALPDTHVTMGHRHRFSRRWGG